MKHMSLEIKAVNMAAMLLVVVLLAKRVEGFNPTSTRNSIIVRKMTQHPMKTFSFAEPEHKKSVVNFTKNEILSDRNNLNPATCKLDKCMNTIWLTTGLSLCILLSSVNTAVALEDHTTNDIAADLQSSCVEKFYVKDMDDKLLEMNNFLISSDSIEKKEVYSSSIDKNEDSNTSSAKAFAQEGGKWFFIVYVVFSFAAGAVEMTKRFQSWLENRQ